MPDGKVSWDNLTSTQQARVLGFHQVEEHTLDERDINLAGGRVKPKKAKKGK